MPAVLFPAWCVGFFCGEYFPAPLAPHSLRCAFSHVVMCLFSAAMGSCNHPYFRFSKGASIRSHHSAKPICPPSLRDNRFTPGRVDGGAKGGSARQAAFLWLGGIRRTAEKQKNILLFDKNIAGKNFYYFVKITENYIDFFTEILIIIGVAREKEKPPPVKFPEGEEDATSKESPTFETLSPKFGIV